MSRPRASDPVERFAVTAGTYVRFVVERGAGLDVIFRADAGRDLMSLLLALAADVPGERLAHPPRAPPRRGAGDRRRPP